jgi:hypothetical protein
VRIGHIAVNVAVDIKRGGDTRHILFNNVGDIVDAGARQESLADRQLHLASSLGSQHAAIQHILLTRVQLFVVCILCQPL